MQSRKSLATRRERSSHKKSSKSEKKHSTKRWKVQDFLRVAHSGMTRKITETKTPDGIKIDSAVVLSDETRGLIRTMGSLQSNQRFKFDINNTSFISTNGSGAAAVSFSMDPTGAPNWTELAAIFDQFRVTGATLRIVQGGGNAANNVPSPIWAAYDNDNSVTPLPATIVAYQNFKFDTVNCAIVFSYKAHRPDLGEYPFISTLTPSSSAGSIPVFIQGPISITNYCSFTLALHCEFLGIR